MYRIQQYMYALVVIGALTGCGKGSSFSLLTETDNFSQGTANAKIDVLWVVDNSGSMGPSQTNLQNNFSDFIGDFIAKNLDFKMSVIATDSYRDYTTYSDSGNRYRYTNTTLYPDPLTWFTGTLNYSLFRNQNSGVHPKVITNAMTAQAISDAFTNNIAVGLTGSGNERAFQSIKAALDVGGISSNANTGFLRPDSFLAVIIVSDEEEFSHDRTTSVESTIGGGSSLPFDLWPGRTCAGAPAGTNDCITNGTTSVNLHTVQSYVDYLDTKTATTGANRRYNVSAIAHLSTFCTGANRHADANIGQRYMNLVDKVNADFTIDATRGKKAEICSSFSQKLKEISDSILSLSSRFPLQRIPIPATIVVKVNGVVIPVASTNPLADGGFEYEAGTNSIVFIGSNYIPPAGATVSVNYDPQSFGM